MSRNPLNLALRFLLELGALYGFVAWGWTTHTGIARWLWAILLPLAAALLWGTFRVPGDPGNAPVAVSGPVRLLVEFVVFGGGIFLLWLANQQTIASLFGILVLLHYVASYDRVLSLSGRGS